MNCLYQWAYTMGVLHILVIVWAMLAGLVSAQSYIPKPPPQTSCPPGHTFQAIGSNEVSTLGEFQESTQTAANLIMTTLFNSTGEIVVSQLSFGIPDNSAISSVIMMRLALLKSSRSKQLILN